MEVARVEFAVLGPLTVCVDGADRALSPMGRSLLGVLLSRANQPVSVDLLVDALWEGRRVANAKQKLQLHVHQVRRALDAGGRITHAAETYTLRVYPGELDAERFESLLTEGREAMGAGEPDRCESLLRKALGLWRGDPYESCGDSLAVRQEAERLTGLRLTALEELYGAALVAGRHAEVVPELTDMVARHRLHEGLRAQLMIALYRSGRSADALRVYREGREALVEELGLEPGPQLREVEAAILAGEEIDLGSSPGVGAAARVVRPAQLPPDLSHLTGRSEHIDALVAYGMPDAESEPGRARITAIDGMPGVGKTTLAVHVAHRLAPHYPDGQLFLDLQGFAQGADPVEPAAALDRMLRALGVPPEQIPSELADRSALWRSLLADRELLVLLDNVVSEAQVRPLLPAAPGCLVLITSRRRLGGLDDLNLASLDVLSAAEAADLFRRTAGPDRVRHAPDDAIAEAVDLCGRLPLAVRIASARLRDRPSWNLDDLISRLRDQRDRLDELESGDRSVAAAFQLSYDQLDAAAGELFRRLGLPPGPDIDVNAAAALGDLPVRVARRLLDALVDVHLLEQREPDRYRFHDLLRGYARQLAEEADAPLVRQAAVERLLDHYSSRLAAAIDLLEPGDAAPRVRVRRHPLREFDDRAAAARWLEAEQRNLIAAGDLAARFGQTDASITLSDQLGEVLKKRRYFAEAMTLHRHALDAAQRNGDLSAEARTLRLLAGVQHMAGAYRDAAALCRRALETYEAVDDPVGEYDALRQAAATSLYLGDLEAGRQHLDRSQSLAVDPADLPPVSVARMETLRAYFSSVSGHYEAAARHSREGLRVAEGLGPWIRAQAWMSLGVAMSDLDRHAAAVDALTSAIDCYDEADDTTGKSLAINLIGTNLRQLGRLDEAIGRHQEALRLARELDDGNAQFEAHRGLGAALRESGRADEAVHHLEHALSLADELDQPVDQARALDELARTHLGRGESARAREHWRRALDLMTELDLPEAQRVRDELAALGDSG